MEKYPEADEHGETSVKGIYITGDLTGIPLLKLAAENGKKVVSHISSDNKLRDEKKNRTDVYDIIIVGAGPAGISAVMEAQNSGLRFVILESAKKFNTNINFPKGKPICAEPSGFQQFSELKITDGTKESLLEELQSTLTDRNLPVEEGVMADEIIREKTFLRVVTGKKEYKALRVILAIGKSGNSRMLNVPGESLPKVYNRFFDPADADGHDVLVVGGGDTALETAIAISEYADSVTLSYRKSRFTRPKEGNIQKLTELEKRGKIRIILNSSVDEIKNDSVIISHASGSREEIKNNMVFTMIGTELPIEFFRRSNIWVEGDKTTEYKLQFLLLLLISGVIYFGKSSNTLYKYFFGGEKAKEWSEIFSALFSMEFIGKFFAAPVFLGSRLFSDSVRIWNVTRYINSFVAYFCFLAAFLLGIYLLWKFLAKNLRFINFDWTSFKYAYFIFTGLFFMVIFFGGKYFGLELFGKSQSFFYTGLYSLTILIFGLRRIYVKPTRYIKYQTWALILIQALPLFILPEFVFPVLGKAGLLGGENSFMMTQVFPRESYWRSYGFILAWPLNMGNLYSGSITSFWLVFSLVQTFVIIPYIVYRWGKGAYCGWICSCGALAETLGDEYRTKAPHGEKAKRWENTGQFILAFAFIITLFKLIANLYNFEIPVLNEKISYLSDFFHKFYVIGIDVIFAGVLGVGVYFFLSGRVWCRFGCPLAALMHIYNKFTRYRIFADKKKCISCNICTKVCHMGIDVMNYANKGIPMNDVECVRCSACVVNCPTQVLSFGSLPESDQDNKLWKEMEIKNIPKENWRSGL